MKWVSVYCIDNWLLLGTPRERETKTASNWYTYVHNNVIWALDEAIHVKMKPQYWTHEKIQRNCVLIEKETWMGRTTSVEVSLISCFLSSSLHVRSMHNIARKKTNLKYLCRHRTGTWNIRRNTVRFIRIYMMMIRMRDSPGMGKLVWKTVLFLLDEWIRNSEEW